MHRLFRALTIYFYTEFTWRAAWRAAGDCGEFRVVAREDGELYIEPRTDRLTAR